MIIKGKVKKEILITSYTCHPSLAINEISGMITSILIAKELSKKKNLYYTYRFVFVPETIGSVIYLKKFGKYLKKNVISSYVINCIGHINEINFNKSKISNSLTNRAAILELSKSKSKVIINDFTIPDSDQAQYSSIGFNIQMANFSRKGPAQYKNYHTSLDNKNLIDFSAIIDTIKIFLNIF